MMGKLQTIGTPWLIGLPAIIYLILAAWTELGLPFPIESFRVPQVTRFDGFSDDNIFPLHDSFRHIASPVALAAIVLGLSFGLIRALRPFSLFILGSLVIIAYLSFLGWDAYISNSDCRFSFGSSLVVEFGQVVDIQEECYEPTDYLRDLRVHTDEHSARQAFSMTAEAMAIIALLAMSSIGAGFGVARLVQRRFRTSIPSAKEFAKRTKALLLASAVSLGIMVVLVPVAQRIFSYQPANPHSRPGLGRQSGGSRALALLWLPLCGHRRHDRRRPLRVPWCWQLASWHPDHRYQRP